MTQELVASMLGVRREGITEAAGNLQRAGIIHYRRGHISVLKRAGLEAATCECYAVVKTEVDRLLHDVQHRQESIADSAASLRDLAAAAASLRKQVSKHTANDDGLMVRP
jgi:Mn-dependent DtxR family transcriptional regulator